AWLACAALALGCGADFDPGSELSGLRVLAVKKSAPYAPPGSRVDLELLWYDDVPERPAPQIAWLAACENPAGDLFEGCFQAAAELTPEGAPAAALDLLASGRLSLPPQSRVLDIGSGPGRLWQENRDRIPRGWEIVLADLSRGMVEEARANLSECGHVFALAVGDIGSLPFADGCF
ncbi:class I SAM-dependent methyltransferase, partial [Lacticaseibacillus rhamnosus]